ncbi:MAG: hypothetical protein KDE31_27735, partial [Caldilineaceae bacterium]|nr:hypothetical protein [Caldilineaceae bacterium]
MAPIRRPRKIQLMLPSIRRTLREWFTLSRGMTIMFVLLLLGAVIIVTQQYPSLAKPEIFCGYSGVPSPLASLVIEGVDMSSNVVHTTLAFSGFSQRQKDFVATQSMIGLNLRDYALQLDRRGNP